MFYILPSIICGNKLGVIEVVVMLLTGKAAGPLYYVVVLIQLTVLTPSLLKTADNKTNWLWMISPLALLITYIATIRTGSIPWYCDTLFPLWLGFYYLGIKLRAGDAFVDSILRKIGTVPCVILAFVLNLAESELLFLIGATPALAISQNRIGGYVYALIIIGLFYNLCEKEHINNKHLNWLGDNSYAIYYTHYFIIRLLIRILEGKIHDIWVLNFGIIYSLTIICTCVIIALVKCVAKKLKFQSYLKYIGY